MWINEIICCQKHFLNVWIPQTPPHPSDFLLFSSPLSTRFFIWPDTCFTLQHVNVKSTSLASVRTPTWIIIWSDVLDGAHVASDNTLKYVLTLSAPSKICDQRQQEQEDGAEEDKAAPHNSLNYTFDKFFVKQTAQNWAVTWLSIGHKPKKRPPFFSLTG